MQTESAKHPVKTPQPTVPSLVAALFTDSKSAHGALADLANAHIHGGQIAVAFAEEAPEVLRSEFDVAHPGASPHQYSLVWRLKHGFERDLHHHGAEVLAGQDVTSAESSAEHPYYVVNLHDTLRGIGVAEDRIALIDRALGTAGVLILVEAGDRKREIQSLLERNCGQIRTDSVTERELASS